MKKRCRLILTRSVSFVFLWQVLLLCACGEGKLEVTTTTMARDLPDETSMNVVVTEFKDGSIDYVLNAAKIDRYYDKRLIRAYKVDILAYDKKTGGTSILKADSTTVDDARNLIFAHGNVQYTSPGGAIATNRLIWDRNMDQITAPDKVTLTRDGNILRGKNLRTNLSIYPTEMDSVSAEGIYSEEFLDW